MNPLLRFVVLSVVASTAMLSFAEETKPAVTYTGKLSTLNIPADGLGADWTGPSGLVVDDFQNTSNCPDEAKPVIEAIKKQYMPIGVLGCADFTYRKKANPFHQVTLRVFVFDSPKSCAKWCKKKYEYEGWEQHYTIVGGVSYKAVDSTQITKRAIWFGNIWMTCHTLTKTTDHIKVLDLYVSKIKALSGEEETGGRKNRQAPAKALDDSPAYKEPDSILYAARKGDLSRVQSLLGKQPQLLDTQDDFKRTPLLYAAKAGHAKVVQYLLKQGSKAVYVRDFYDFTPVHWAAMYAQNDVLKVFAEHEIDLNCRGMDGQTPLHMAMGNMFSNAPKHEETVKLLVSLKVDVNAQDNGGRAPLHVGASLVGKAESVRALLDNSKEVKVDLRSRDGSAALHTAAALGRADIAEILLAKGANPALKRDDGKTPIDLADECVVDSRREAIVRVFAQLKNGKTTSGSSGDR